MLRRTPLKRSYIQRPRIARDNFVPLCRRCHQSKPDVRFKPMRPRLCLTCKPDHTPARKTQVRTASDDPKHLAYVRTHLCACAGFGCLGRVEAHHIRTAANSGTGKKPTDLNCVPLCLAHHAELHLMGKRSFADKYRVDLPAIAMSIAASANKSA